ncbi:hypothetical protein CC85DRAFT_285597 [Cutaneotrichosporon oleaginosum]|uniref:DUF3533 domain-containing protein n=1 Tax=Cutaneotrichosporon oleaginosum TaxID=879819 RepID=A0A0J0XMQ3_9TREE|nr:uncharacterized protein CC85DRAFT_285597 [Cutaneotrichosporon oleaginosum]KLT42363.1 hypothetical protein CC85DRAFT_285597 [Cutaneotrichosporon oleaginosum]TXT04183.1 hypothetical protein COLE_07880 [Cutaneotrichosporon oleaginosum]
MHDVHDEARDKVPDFGIPPSRATSPASPVVRPGLNRTVTSGTRASRLSRISSKLPNPERAAALGPVAPPPPPPHLTKYAYHFFSPEIKFFRALVVKILGMMVVLTTVIMWLAAPFYWGSLWKANHYTDKLTVRVIDRDGGDVGAGVTSFLLSQRKKGGLGYFVTSPSEFPTDAELYHDIVQEGAWGAVVINAGATDNLARARASANASYDGRDAIQLVYAQARNEIATGSYMVPLATAHLSQITAQLGARSVASFLSTADAAALARLADAPGTLAAPLGFRPVNLRPYDQPVAQAITLVGLIYMLIFSFICTMANNGAREIISPYLTNRAYIAYRLISPFVLYFPLSFAFSLINLPFKLSFGANSNFTYAGAFFCFWFLMFLGMASVGLATEVFITLVGPKFVSFTLIPLIIVNVSVAALPYELQPWIYRYGVAMPFNNANHAIRFLIFGTRNELGRNFGILLAWIVVSMVNIALATYFFRRKAVNEHAKQVGEREKDTALPDGRIV